MNDFSTDFMKIVKLLIIRDPFYGNLLLTLDKQVSTKVPTACVTINNKFELSLLINEEYWFTLSDDHKYGLLKHEMLHVAMFHLFLMKDFEHARIYNVAADIALHEHMDTQHINDQWITRASFPDLKLKEFESAEYYYNQLINSKHVQFIGFGKGSGQCQGDGDQDGNSDGSGDRDEDGNGGGKYDKFMDMDDKDGEGSEFQKELVRKNLEQKVREVMKSTRGYVPAFMDELLEKFKEPEPILDWKRIIRYFGTASTETYTRTSRNKRNKRYADWPALKFKPKLKLLAAIDTSGSVSSSILVEFFEQLFYIMKTTGAQIDIIECDAAIGKRYTLQKNQEIKVTGRGGTDFTPPVEIVNKEGYNSLIYFTDGEGSYNCELKKKALWVIYNHHESEDSHFSHLKGKRIYVPN